MRQRLAVIQGRRLPRGRTHQIVLPSALELSNEKSDHAAFHTGIQVRRVPRQRLLEVDQSVNGLARQEHCVAQIFVGGGVVGRTFQNGLESCDRLVDLALRA